MQKRTRKLSYSLSLLPRNKGPWNPETFPSPYSRGDEVASACERCPLLQVLLRGIPAESPSPEKDDVGRTSFSTRYPLYSPLFLSHRQLFIYLFFHFLHFSLSLFYFLLLRYFTFRAHTFSTIYRTHPSDKYDREKEREKGR